MTTPLLALDISVTDIRVIAGILALIVLVIIIWRRKRKAAE
jgi:LPXTG-motif cell wall-anchored protein